MFLYCCFYYFAGTEELYTRIQRTKMDLYYFPEFSFFECWPAALSAHHRGLSRRSEHRRQYNTYFPSHPGPARPPLPLAARPGSLAAHRRYSLRTNRNLF